MGRPETTIKSKRKFVPKKKKNSSKDVPSTSTEIQPKKVYKSAYKRAQETYEKIQIERRAQKEELKLEKQKRIDSTNEYESIKQKMNKVLCKKNKKGQPKLNAQIAVLLEKIQRRISK